MKVSTNKVFKTGLLILTFGVGLYGGSFIQNYTNQEKKNQMHTNTRVAVVNLDEGVFYNHKPQYFANELLTKEEKDIEITGYSDALSGMKNGKYSSYIIIPTDFSKNMVSINTQPHKTLLKYEISNSLEENTKEIAFSKVMKIKEHLNDDLGYMYIKSIMKAFHNGQDNALNVLLNDKKDKEVISKISNMDLIKTVNLGELKRLQNQIAKLNVDKDVVKNQEIINEVKEKYKKYLSQANISKKEVEEKSQKVLDRQQPLLDKIESTQSVLNNGKINFELTQTKQEVEKYNKELNKQKDELKKLISNANILKDDDDTSITDDINHQLDKEQIENEINKYITNCFLNHLNTQTQKPLSEVLGKKTPKKIQSKLLEYAKLNNLSDSDAQNYDIMKYFNEHQDIKALNTKINQLGDKIETSILNQKEKYEKKENQKLNLIQQQVDKLQEIPFKDLENNLIVDANILDAKQIALKNKIIRVFEKNLKLTNQENNQLKNFDFLTFVKNEEVQKLYNEYINHNKVLKEEVIDKNNEYVTFANNVDKNALEQISKMHTNIEEQKKTSDEQVTKGLKNAKQVKNNNSDANQRLLSTFISQLKTTRDNNKDNIDSYKLINHPLNEQQVKNNSINQNQIPDYAIITTFVVTLTSLSMLGYVLVKTYLKK